MKAQPARASTSDAVVTRGHLSLVPAWASRELPRAERILAARRLAEGGMTPGAIAGTLGVARSTVARYLHGGAAPRRRSWSDDDIVDAIWSWAAENDGRVPSYADFRAASDRTRWPDARTVARRFGGWRAALVAAGILS